MHPQTQAIASFETDQDAKDAGYTVPLTLAEAKTLFGVNRHERRKALVLHRRQQKRANKQRTPDREQQDQPTAEGCQAHGDGPQVGEPQPGQGEQLDTRGACSCGLEGHGEPEGSSGDPNA